MIISNRTILFTKWKLQNIFAICFYLFVNTHITHAQSDTNNSLVNPIPDVNTTIWASITYADFTNNDFDTSENLDILHLTGFGFPIPLSSSIDGIFVEIERYKSFGDCNVNVIQLTDATSTLVGDNKASGTTWAVSETNNNFFTIEKTGDDENRKEVAKIQDAGHLLSVLSYSFRDRRPYSGLSYYLLKQTDFDEQYSYSDVRPYAYKFTGCFSLKPTNDQIIM